MHSDIGVDRIDRGINALDTFSLIHIEAADRPKTIPTTMDQIAMHEMQRHSNLIETAFRKLALATHTLLGNSLSIAE